jgi:hypothetical protein
LDCADRGKTDDGVHEFSGEAAARPLRGRTFSAVAVTAPGGGAGFAAARPFARTFDVLPFDPAGADRVEVLLVFVLNNLQQPRTRFPR